ncbi:MAG: hypothetical protein KF731_17425, partial [Thauera sp.]|nr:hypothetical protein [Thauera sp.]
SPLVKIQPVHLINIGPAPTILRGLLMRGHVFGNGQDDAATLGLKTANNVGSLCLREQMILDRAAESAIARWFGTAQVGAHLRQ